jgi:hypothetical protein
LPNKEFIKNQMPNNETWAERRVVAAAWTALNALQIHHITDPATTG